MVVYLPRIFGPFLCLLLLGLPSLGTAQALPSTTLTTAERVFLRDLATQVERGGDIARDASTALESPLYSERFDRLWTEVVRNFEDLYEQAVALEPSARQAHLAVLWIEATAILADSTNLFKAGIDSFDSDVTDEATAMLNEASAIIDTLTADRDEFVDDPNVIMARAVKVRGPVDECAVFSSFEVAQVYYALHPEEQRVLDANRDGRACEKEFDRLATIPRKVGRYTSDSGSTPTTAKPTIRQTPAAAPTKTAGTTSTAAPGPTDPPTTTVKPSESPTATPSPTTAADGDHFTFEGTGSQVETFTITKKGLYLMTIETPGTIASATVYTMDGNAVASTLLGRAEETNEVAIPLDSGDYYIQISGSSGWTVTIEPMH